VPASDEGNTTVGPATQMAPVKQGKGRGKRGRDALKEVVVPVEPTRTRRRGNSGADKEPAPAPPTPAAGAALRRSTRRGARN
jgi:hypothetical protein